MSDKVHVPANDDAILEPTGEPTPSDTATGGISSLRDELIAEAKKAHAAERGDEPVEPKSDEPEPDKTPPEPDDAGVKIVAKALREREKRREAELEIQAARDEAKAALAEAKAAREAAQKEREEWLTLMKTKPADAIRAAGWEPESLVMNLANDGTPASALERQLMAMQAKIEAAEKWRAERETRESEASRQAEERAQQGRIAEANTAFTSLATEAGKYPTLAALYSDDAEPLLTQAYKVAHEYQQRTGLVASHAEVAEYLESIHSDRVRRLHQPSEPRAIASQTGTAHGQRTLSTDSASERRSPTRSLEELTPDERRRELISVAKKARQAG